MAIIKCKKCGALIVAEVGKNVVRCKDCGTMQVVSNDNDKQKQFAQRRRLATRLGKMITAGDWHSVGLKPDGTVVAVGANKKGQCRTQDWTDVVAISAGQWHTVGLRADGTVIATEPEDLAEKVLGSFSQCGVGYWKDIVAIAAGNCHTVGLKKDGSVVLVGCIKDHDESNIDNFMDYLYLICKKNLSRCWGENVLALHAPTILTRLAKWWICISASRTQATFRESTKT